MNSELTATEVSNNEFVSSLQDINAYLKGVAAPARFHAHTVNLNTGKHGIENMIVSILKEHGAVFNAGDENGEFRKIRKIVVSQSLYASEIITQVELRFAAGGLRYKYQVVYNYLCTIMQKNKKVHGFKLTNVEDCDRTCPKVRKKFFLVMSNT